jgi:hypothetical protein
MMTWRDDAACTQVDPELFFPDEETGWRPQAHARRVCATCPVQRECLADAPAWDRYSIRAGMTGRARRTPKETAA